MSFTVSVTASVNLSPVEEVYTTLKLYSLFVSESAADSWFSDAVTTPVLASIVKSPASVPVRANVPPFVSAVTKL